MNPTLLARSIKPTAAASSSAFALITVVSPSDDTSQSLKTTFTSRYARTAEPKFDVQHFSSD